MTTLPLRSAMEVAAGPTPASHHPQNPANPPIDCYEDMFKEITRKLYGEEGLPDYPGAERALTNLVSAERGLTTIDYDAEGNAFKPEDHITAFGLAALMQNGFPPPGILNANFTPKLNNSLEDKWTASEESLPWTGSKIASYNPAQKLFRCAECECVGFMSRVAEHWLGAHGSLRPFQCPQCPYASAWSRCAKLHLSREHNVPDASAETIFKENPVLDEVTKYLQRLKGKLEGPKQPEFNNPVTPVPVVPRTTTTSTQNTPIETPAATTTKRYNCGFCPYATDRRDLYTRHENIHREEKPFQCYVCQKQFNRADHVKKHFLRMHREHPYDLNRIRRQPSTKSPVYNYPKFNTDQQQQNSLSIPSGFQQQPQQQQQQQQPQQQQRTPIKNEKSKNNGEKASSKKKGEKRYSCCYCSWSGVDNWCLKRHLNTHLKPFVCGLCDYKAARSERLATHVLKVHNKKACSKCNFLADDQPQLTAHQQEHHPLDSRPPRNNNSNNNNNGGVLRTLAPLTGYSNAPGPPHTAPVTPFGSVVANMRTQLTDQWRPPPKQGAERLFHYMEASDGSEPEEQQYSSSNLQPVMQTISQDFPKTGDTHSKNASSVSPVKTKRLEQLFNATNRGNKENISLPLQLRLSSSVFKENSTTNKQLPKIDIYNAAKITIKSESPTKSEYAVLDLTVKQEPLIKAGTVTRKRKGPSPEIISNNNDLPLDMSVVKICKENAKEILLDTTSEDYEDVDSFQDKDLMECDTIQDLDTDCTTSSQNSDDKQYDLKRSRKQTQPRKVFANAEESEKELLTLAEIRDIHLTKNVTRKSLSCKKCPKTDYLYHNRSSLVVHTNLRHPKITLPCPLKCGQKFMFKYQLMFHKKKCVNYKKNKNSASVKRPTA